MKTYRIIPIAIIICLLIQGFTLALAVCEKPCCTADTSNTEAINIFQPAGSKSHQCHGTGGVQDRDQVTFHQGIPKIAIYHIEDKSPIPISLTYLGNNLSGRIRLQSVPKSCDCDQKQSDSVYDQKAFSPGFTRVEKPHLFVLLQASSDGLLSPKFSSELLSVKSQSTGSVLLIPLYLKNLSLLI